jgi:hypothetical protein
MMVSFRVPTLLLLLVSTCVEGFILHPAHHQSPIVPLARRSMELSFGLPSFQTKGDKKDDEPEDPKLEKSSIGLKGLVQLITAGAGAPFLGDFQASKCSAPKHPRSKPELRGVESLLRSL